MKSRSQQKQPLDRRQTLTSADSSVAAHSVIPLQFLPINTSTLISDTIWAQKCIFAVKGQTVKGLHEFTVKLVSHEVNSLYLKGETTGNVQQALSLRFSRAGVFKHFAVHCEIY